MVGEPVHPPPVFFPKSPSLLLAHRSSTQRKCWLSLGARSDEFRGGSEKGQDSWRTV